MTEQEWEEKVYELTKQVEDLTKENNSLKQENISLQARIRHYVEENPMLKKVINELL